MELKFLTLLSEEQIDYKLLLQKKLRRTKLRWYHTFLFLRTLSKLHKEIEVLRKLDPLKVEYSNECSVIKPDSIDLISYGAMIELQTLLQNPGDREVGDLIIEQIAISCYESHTKQKFDSDSEEFSNFRDFISEQDIVHMLGLHNWIHNQTQESIEKWNGLFEEVRVFDKDWDNAGGAQMKKFDVLNTIRKTCEAFNVNYYEALQMPYGLTQANCLSDATRYFIHDRMKDIIQARMEENQRNL